MQGARLTTSEGCVIKLFFKEISNVEVALLFLEYKLIQNKTREYRSNGDVSLRREAH